MFYDVWAGYLRSAATRARLRGLMARRGSARHAATVRHCKTCASQAVQDISQGAAARRDCERMKGCLKGLRACAREVQEGDVMMLSRCKKTDGFWRVDGIYYKDSGLAGVELSA